MSWKKAAWRIDILKVKGKLGVVLTIAAGIGLVVTVIATAKKTPEAQKAKEEAIEKKRQATGDENAQLTTIESIKAQVPTYAPVIFSAAITAGTIIGSQVLPQNVATDLEKWKRAYRDISTKVNGPEAEKLMNGMAHSAMAHKETQGTLVIKKETFILRFNDHDIPFESTIVDVLIAEYDANKLFKGAGSITFNQLLNFFHLKNEERGDEFGWDVLLGEKWYGYSWIDFNHRRAMLDGKPVTYIDMPFECHILNEECEEEANG